MSKTKRPNVAKETPRKGNTAQKEKDMKKNKLGALAVSIAMASALCAPTAAFAAANTDGALDASTTSADSTAAGGADSTLTGKIKVTTLSVSVPTAATFNVDPTVAATDAGSQFTSPTNYTIVNKSVVPVWAQISNVAVTGNSTAGSAVALTKRSADVTGTTMQFGISDITDASSADLALSTEDNWLVAGAQTYNAFNKGENSKLAAKDATADGGDDQATMYFYGKVDNTYAGWADGDSFTITPTFTISTTAPTPAP